MATWQLVERRANERPECQRVRLLTSHHEPERRLIVSEWDDVPAFNRFVRETGLLWIERDARHLRTPITYTYLSGIQRLAVGGETARQLSAEALTYA